MYNLIPGRFDQIAARFLVCARISSLGYRDRARLLAAVAPEQESYKITAVHG